MAAAAYFASCNPENPENCYKAGKLWCKEANVKEVDEPAPIDDLLRGREAYSIGCDSGHGESCLMLAALWKWHFRESDGLLKAREAYQKARKYIERSCVETGEDCSSLTMLVSEGNGGPSDCVLARKIGEDACDKGHGDPMMCGSVAGSLYLGSCGPQDLEKARSYYKRLCGSIATQGNPCIALGQMCEKGVGGPVDMKCARESYQRDCFEWKEAGCPHLERITGEPQKPKQTITPVLLSTEAIGE